MATGQTSPKTGKVVDIPANAPTIGTATAGGGSASVTFTAPSTSTGGPISSYTVLSNPGSVVGTGTTSPITVSSLTSGTPILLRLLPLMQLAQVHIVLHLIQQHHLLH